MMIADVKKAAELKMQKSVETLKNDLGKVRTGRAHTGLLDHVRVDYYGSMMPLNQVANVTLTEERRKELVKVVHKEAENTRIAVRNIRRDAITQFKDLLKSKSISEDDE